MAGQATRGPRRFLVDPARPGDSLGAVPSGPTCATIFREVHGCGHERAARRSVNIHAKIKGGAGGAIVTVLDPKADPGESLSPAVHRKQLMIYPLHGLTEAAIFGPGVRRSR